jgi:hypothetical protein
MGIDTPSLGDLLNKVLEKYEPMSQTDCDCVRSICKALIPERIMAAILDIRVHDNVIDLHVRNSIISAELSQFYKPQLIDKIKMMQNFSCSIKIRILVQN